MKRKLLVGTVGVVVVVLLAGVAYLVGLLSQRGHRLELEREVASLQSRVGEAEARGRVCALYTRAQDLIDMVSEKNYGQAAQSATTFFDEVRAESNRTNQPAFREALVSVLGMRDAVTGSLTKADPVSLEQLHLAAGFLRGALENRHAGPPSTPPAEAQQR